MPVGRTLHALRMRVDMLGTVGGHMWKARGAARGQRHVQETRDIGGISKGRAGRARHHPAVLVLVLPNILKLVHRSNTFLVKTRSLSAPAGGSRAFPLCEVGSTPVQWPANISGERKDFASSRRLRQLERTYFAIFLTNIARKQEFSQRT